MAAESFEMKPDYHKIDQLVAGYMNRWGIPAIRFSFAIIFFWFGILKPLGVSPAEPLLKATVMTQPGANSGIYIHTQYQEDGWPTYGYEVQVNNSQEDWRRTGSLYAIVDVKENYANDNEWYTEYVKVEGNRIIIKINDIVTVDYTQPENPLRGDGEKERILKRGTFALQGHDPGSVVFYKDIMVRPLK